MINSVSKQFLSKPLAQLRVNFKEFFFLLKDLRIIFHRFFVKRFKKRFSKIFFAEIFKYKFSKMYETANIAEAYQIKDTK